MDESTRVCPECGLTKSAGAFTYTRPGGRTYRWCDACVDKRRAYFQVYYAAHRDEIKAKVKAWQQAHPGYRVRQVENRREYRRRNRDTENAQAARHRERIRGWLLAARLASPCIVCGEREPACLDFHHLNASEKAFNISAVTGSSPSRARLIRELAKCVTLCANCHRKVHAGVLTPPAPGPRPNWAAILP